MKIQTISNQINSAMTVNMYTKQLMNLAMNVFVFPNMPKNIDKSYMNRQLLKKGSIAFFYDDVLKEINCLPYDTIGKLDIYGRPLEIMVRNSQGQYYRKLSNRPGSKPEDNFIIMYDNNLRVSIFPDVVQYAVRISLHKKIQDINIFQQKTPRQWKTTEDRKAALKNMLEEIDSFSEEITTYDSVDVDELSSVMAPAPFIADKIDQRLDREWAEFFRLIGIASITEQKRERMIKDEMIASQGGTIASRFSRYESRLDAIELINEKWADLLKKPIEVEYYDGVPSSEKKEEVIEEVDENDL